MSKSFTLKYLCSSPLAHVSHALTYVVHITSAILALPRVTLSSLERFLSDITVVHSCFYKNSFVAQAKYPFITLILG